MRKVLLLLLFALGISWAQAAYLRNVPVTVTQPDGTKLECFASGDEFYNYLHDAEGFTIIQDQHTGFYVYADLKNDELVSTTLIAGKDNPAGKLPPNLNISSEKRMQMRKAWEIPERYRVEQTRTGEANHGKLNNISIFIRFSDDLEFTNTYSSINNMFNDSTASAVSMYNYFKEASYGQVYVPTTFYPGHSGETIISYQDTQARGFFQPYNAVTNTSGYQTDAERATREFDLLERAVNYVNTNNPIPSSLNIDYDSDGYVDNVCFIVRGNVGDWGSLLWPHKWNLYDRTVSINGKVVNVFNFQLADATYYFNTSTMCHEMNHSFGAPDLYHYNDSYDDLAPVGPWDLMEQNATPPQHMGAYMKYKYGNWIDEIPEITSSGTYTLNDLSSSTNNCYKIASGVSGQYYVLEYRKQSVETALPGSGLLIYRINTAFTGNADYDPDNGEYDEIYLYRPGGTTSANGNIYNAYFSSGSGRTAFHSGTNPQPFYTDGSVNNDLMITDITAAGNTISFTYSAGFHVTPNNVSIHPAGGSTTVTFESGPETSTWTASSNQSWLTVSPASGNGSGSINTITLSATANATNNSRTAVVTFTQAGNTATVTVSQDVAIQGNFSYDFEACTDFAVDDFPPCTTYDGDGFSTIGFSGFDYPNKFYTGSFIAYNESQASGSSGFEAHQGSKIGACFRSNGVQNNDWLITPMISLKSNSQLSFYAKTFLNQYGLERFRVLISTTSNAPSDFTLISSGEYVEAPTSWTQYTYDLSAYDGQSIYIAIQCVSNSALAFLIDDISVTSEETMPENHYWQPITTAQADWEGNYLITYSNPALSTVKALSGKNSNYGVGTEIYDHYNQDGFISLDALTFGMRVTVEETSTGKYSLYLNEVGYLGWSSANSLRFDSDVTANQNEWLISVSGGIVTLTSANDATRKLKWNASSPRFACYTSAQSDIALFKLVPIPALENPVISPESGFYYASQQVTISCQTTGASIRYTLDGSVPNNSSTLYTLPFQVSTNTTVKAISCLGSDQSTVVEKTYSFPVSYANIAAFKAAYTATSTEVARITGDVTFVYRSGRYMFVKDATGGLLIYDNTTPVITNTYSNGDVISGGLCGTYTKYNGMVEMIPTQNTAAGVTGTEVLPIEVTAADLVANYSLYESQLVKIVDVAFNSTFTFGNQTTFAQNGTTMTAYNRFGNLNLSVVAGDEADVVGFASVYNTTYQVFPRNNDDVDFYYDITVDPSITGGTVSASVAKATSGKSVILSNTPAASYSFDHYTVYETGNSSNTVTVSSNTFNMPEFDVDVSAVFNYVPASFTISATASPAEGGTIEGTGAYTIDATATLVATANAGFYFSNWSESGTVVSTSESYSFTVESNRTFVANFVACGSINADASVLSNALCFGETINLIGAPSIEGLTYSWTGPNGFTSSLMSPEIQNASVANSGSYILEVILEPGCSDKDTVEVTVFPEIELSPIANITVCDGENASVEPWVVQPAFAGVNDTITKCLWTNDTPSIGLAASGEGNIADFIASNNSAVPVEATISVTAYLHCNGTICTGNTETFTITVNPISNETVEETACNSYIWAGNTYTESGTYSNTFTNIYGCDSIVSMIITILHQPIVENIAELDTIANGQSLSLVAPSVNNNNSPITSQGWQISDEMDFSGTVEAYVGQALPYTYDEWYLRYFATNECGTAYSNVVMIHILDISIIESISQPDTICSGESLTLVAPTVYYGSLPESDHGWNLSATNTFDDFIDYVNQPLDHSYDGWYLRFFAYIGEEVNYSNTVQIGVMPTPEVAITAPEPSYCPNQTITINAVFSLGQSPYVTTWGGDLTVENETLSSSSASATFVLPSANNTSYNITLYVTDANGCVSAISDVDINVLDTIAPTITGTVANQNALSVENCVWLYPDVRELVRALSSDNCVSTEDLIINQSPEQNTSIASSDNDVVTVTVLDASGNSASTEVIIEVPEILSIVSTTHFNLNCYGADNGYLSMSISGGVAPYTFTLTGQETATSAPMTNTQYTFEGLSAGDYTMTATDAEGCEVTADFTLTQPAELLVTINSVVGPSCVGSNDGHAVAQAVGGVEPYSYEWNTDPAFTGQYCGSLSAGSYTVTVTDANDCVATETVVIVDPEPIVVSIDNYQNPVCHGEQSGWAEAVVTGGTPGYTYSWSNGSTTSNIDNLAAGTYTLTVIDNNGCEATGSVTLTEPEAITLSITDQQNASCYGVADGEATVLVEGGVEPLSYLWEPSGQTTNMAHNLAAGVHTVTVTDANGCEVFTTVNITQPDGLMPGSISSQGEQVCDGDDPNEIISISNATSGQQNFVYRWKQNGVVISDSDVSIYNPGVLPVGTYVFTREVMDVCTDWTASEGAWTVEVLENPEIVITGDFLIESGESTTLTAEGAEHYLWSTGETTASITVSPVVSTTYSVLGTNGASCSAEEEVTVEVIPEGISENGLHDLQLYPNPTKSDVKVFCKGMKRASIMTLTGQVMSFENVNADEAILSFRSYAPGIYMVKIETNDGVVLMRRVTLTK